MSPVDEKAQQDKLEAERLVAAIPLIPEVQRIDVELYTDNTGDPAFQLLFHLRPKVKVTEPFLNRFNTFAAQIQTSILASGLNRFPYTRLRKAA